MAPQIDTNLYKRILHAIYLGEEGMCCWVKGKLLAASTLREAIGASTLMENVVEAAIMMIEVATFSRKVHGAWHEELIRKCDLLFL